MWYRINFVSLVDGAGALAASGVSMHRCDVTVLTRIHESCVAAAFVSLIDGGFGGQQCLHCYVVTVLTRIHEGCVADIFVSLIDGGFGS